ncbi:MAG TPA: hypothetical protein VFG51_00110 [Candidatus Saccharimonadia bacterium]|nr:hypothetical protein [Candidatus Saccharimonadia bacterium]
MPEPNATESYHRFLCRQRAACEGDLACFSDPKVVRNVNGQDRVYCYKHDPENGFAEWLDATNDAIEQHEI